MSEGTLALVEPKSIIERYLAGDTTTVIAESLGVTRQGLGWHLRKHAEEDWREAQVILAIERKEKAQEAMDSAADVLSLARAREQLKSAQWDLERVLKRIYGPSQEVTGKDGGPIAIEIVRYGSQVLEGQVVREPIADTEVVQHLPKK